MKTEQVKIGEVYGVRISGNVQPVRILRIYERGRIGIAKRSYPNGWIGLNLNTNREITIRSASKLRYRMTKTDKGWRITTDEQGEVVRLRGAYYVFFQGRRARATWLQKGPAEAQLDLLRRGHSTLDGAGNIKHHTAAPIYCVRCDQPIENVEQELIYVAENSPAHRTCPAK